MSEPVRINKYLSENGYCSRREADRLVASGNVFINNKKAELGDKVSESDSVRVQGRDKKKAPEYTYILLNKPFGAKETDYIDEDKQIFPVGYLDNQSEGLIFLTNDEALANRMLNPRYEFEKEYVVTVDHILSSKDITKLQKGVKLEDGITLPAQVRKMDDQRFAIIVQEYRNNLIRRMCETLGYDVVSLKRTRILTLKMQSTYPEGNWRYLTELEVSQLKKAVGIVTKKENYKLHK